MASINSCAIVVNDADNVAVVKTPIAAGTLIEMNDGRSIVVSGDIATGNRFATKPIPAGELVLQYGQPVGTSLGLGLGSHLAHQYVR